MPRAGGLAERLEVARPHLLGIARRARCPTPPSRLAVHVDRIVAQEVDRADHVVPRRARRAGSPARSSRPGTKSASMPEPEVGLVADELAVRVEVVVRPVAVPGVLPDVERLHEAVDVLGHAELLDPALGRGLAVALGVRGGEVALGGGALLVGAQVDVVVGQHQRRTPRPSAGPSARGDLEVLGRRLHHAHRSPGGLHQRRVVGGGGQRRGVDVERARAARRHGTPAASGPPTARSGRACARTRPSGAGLLDRVGHRRGGDRAVDARSSAAMQRSHELGA